MTKQISFKDIRKGDYIEVVWTRGDRTSTVRGIAHHRAVDGWWETRERLMLVGPRDDGTIYRHPRPVLPEPEGLGAVIEYAGNEYVSINRTPGKPRWVLVADNHTYNEAVVYSWSEFDPDSIEVEP